MFRVGIVGCGGIAQVHARVLKEIIDTTLIACADIRPERARAMAEAYGCTAYASLEEMLAKETPDAVHICTPHALHAPMAKLLSEKGIAVFSEKPPITTQEQWEVMAEAASKVPLGICFQNRYNPNVQQAKHLIESKTYGSVLGARAFVTWSRDASYYADSGWRGTWAQEGGGVLINQSIHTLDLLIYLLGKADKVEAHMANHHLQGVIEVEDTLEAYLLLEGKPTLFYATTAYASNAPVMVEVTMEKAVLRMENDALEIRTPTGTDIQTFSLPDTLGKNYWGNGHLTCISDFYDSIRMKRPFRNDLKSVENTAKAMLSIYAQGKKDL